MGNTLSPSDVSLLFSSGAELGYYVVACWEAGKLALPSGRIVVCDPIANPTRAEFAINVKRGKYPVLVATVGDEGGEVAEPAGILLQLGDAEPDRWQLATVAGEKVAKLKKGKLFGAAVDTSVCAMMDANTAQTLAEIYAEQGSEAFDERLRRKLQDSAGWATMPVKKGSRSNLVAFFVDDGVHPSYWGFDGSDQVVALATIGAEYLSYVL